MEKQILNIVVAPLIHDNKILLLQRNKQPFKDMWGMPGGKINFGEHIEEALKREIFEETGLDIVPKRLFAVVSEVFFDKQKKEDYWHCLIFLFDVTISRTNVLKRSREGAIKWFTLNELPKDQIIPSDYAMIQQIVLKPVMNVCICTIKMLHDNGTFTMEYFKK